MSLVALNQLTAQRPPPPQVAPDGIQPLALRIKVTNGLLHGAGKQWAGQQRAKTRSRRQVEISFRVVALPVLVAEGSHATKHTAIQHHMHIPPVLQLYWVYATCSLMQCTPQCHCCHGMLVCTRDPKEYHTL